MLLNLLLNACKASPEHGRVGLAVEQSATQTVFAVADSGEGMPDDVLAFIADGRTAAPMTRGKGSGCGWSRACSTTSAGRSAREPHRRRHAGDRALPLGPAGEETASTETAA